MKLPYLLIPRVVYEDARRDLDAARERVKELETLLIDLKLDGAQVIRYNPEAARRKQERPELDLIDEAIDANPKSRLNPILARGQRLWADKMLAQKKDVAWIVLRLRTWDKVTTEQIDESEDAEDRAMGLIE